jgi:hypothetical protein
MLRNNWKAEDSVHLLSTMRKYPREFIPVIQNNSHAAPSLNQSFFKAKRVISTHTDVRASVTNRLMRNYQSKEGEK